MEDQELQHLWKQASPKAGIQIESSGLSSGLNVNLRRFNKEIKNRNIRESLAGVIVCVAFTSITFLVPGLLAKTGAALCAAYGLMIVVVVNYIKTHQEEDYTLSLKDYLLSQRLNLLRERKLLN